MIEKIRHIYRKQRFAIGLSLSLVFLFFSIFRALPWYASGIGLKIDYAEYTGSADEKFIAFLHGTNIEPNGIISVTMIGTANVPESRICKAMRAKNLSVHVPAICAGACFSSVFLCASKKLVLSDAIVGYDQDPVSALAGAREKLGVGTDSSALGDAEREAVDYARIAAEVGINPALFQQLSAPLGPFDYRIIDEGKRKIIRRTNKVQLWVLDGRLLRKLGVPDVMPFRVNPQARIVRKVLGSRFFQEVANGRSGNGHAGDRAHIIVGERQRPFQP